MKRTLLLSYSVFLAATTAWQVAAEDWAQWRGPRRNGTSTETGLMKEWPKEGPTLLWQIQNVGDGFSTPAVFGDRLFVLSNEGTENESVQALSTRDGARIWSTRIGKVGPNEGPQYPGARGTPTIDGDVLYALGSDGDLVCVETGSGRLRWQKNLRSEFSGRPGKWAYAESPLVDGDVVVCTPGGAAATVVALKKQSGEVVWKAALEAADEAGYASVIVVETGGVRQYVQFLSKGLVGLEARSGRLLWRYGRTAQGSPANIPTPVADDGYVYSGAGRTGAGLVKVKADKGAFAAEEVYFSPKLPTSIGGAVKVGDHLYGSTAKALVCVEFTTGNVKWEEQSVGTGAVCHVDDRIYLFGENGAVTLFEATAGGYREKGRFNPPNRPDHGPKRSRTWTHPVIANGRLYLRDLNALWCYDIKGR